MEKKLEIVRKENRDELLMMKVSSPTRSSNLHHFTVIHHGVDIMSSDRCPFSHALHFYINIWKPICI
jgi:hypothetical protein